MKLKFDIHEIDTLLKGFDLRSEADKETVNFIYNNVIEYGKRQDKTMDIQRDKARIFFPITITLMVFLTNGIVVSYDKIFTESLFWNGIIIVSIILPFIFLFLSSRKFHNVLRNYEIVYEVAPVHDLNIYKEEYKAKLAIIYYLFKQLQVREERLIQLAKYIGSGIRYMYYGIVFVFIFIVVLFVIFNIYQAVIIKEEAEFIFHVWSVMAYLLMDCHSLGQFLPLVF